MTKKAMTIVATDLAAIRTARSQVKVPGEPLNFRVPPDFGRRFRVYAAERRMRLSDVLIQAFEALEQKAP
ncbi:MAG: hypothetical protein WBM14_09765 [Terracidiphilus sp.]